MPLTVGNLIVGSANLFEGDTSSLRDVGGTTGGVVLALGGHDFVRLEVDQIRGVADVEEIMKSFTLRTTMSEPTLSNLAIAFNQGDSSNDTTNDILTIEDNPRGKRTVVFVGPAPGTNKHRSFCSSQCVFVGTSEHTYQRGDGTTVPLELELIPAGRTYAQTMNVQAAIDSSYVQVNSVISGATDLIREDKVIGGILSVVSGTGSGQSRAVTDSTTITSTGAGTLAVYPSFSTTPAADDNVYLQANKAALWGTIKDV